MFKKRLVVLLLLFMAVGAYAQSIPSGTGRIEALGNSPFILDAATDIFNNPAWSNYYRNYAFGDFGRNATGDFSLSDQYAGVSFGVTKKLALGLILNKRSDSWSDFNSLVGTGFNPGGKDPVVPTMILIGYSANKDFHLGLAPYITMWSRDSISGNHEDKGSSTSFGANLGFMKMMKKNWVEGVVDFRMNSFKREVTDSGSSSTWKSEGGIQLGVGLRGWFYAKGGKIAIVPVLGFHTYSWNPRYTQTGPSFDTVGAKYSELGFNGAVGLNWPISDDIQLAFGVGANYNSEKVELGTSKATQTDFVAPQFYIAGETRIADWLTARFGYNRGVDMSKLETVSGSFTSSNSESIPTSDVQTVSVGSGFHFGRFSVDATVSERWLKHGFNFISGGDNTDLFGVISTSYNFNK